MRESARRLGPFCGLPRGDCSIEPLRLYLYKRKSRDIPIMMRDQNSGKPWIGASQERADCSWLSLLFKAIESKWFIRKKDEIIKRIESFRSTAESSLRLARTHLDQDHARALHPLLPKSCLRNVYAHVLRRLRVPMTASAFWPSRPADKWQHRFSY